MSQNNPKGEPDYISRAEGGLILERPEEREARQRREQQQREESDRQARKEYDSTLLKIQIRQADAEGLQAKTNTQIKWLTFSIAIVSAVSAFISFMQFQVADKSAKAAESAAKAATETLVLMDKSAKDSGAQADRVIQHLGSLATSMNDSLKESRKALDVTTKQSNAILDDSRQSFLVQNRPYVTVEIARLLFKPEAGKRLEATVLIRNSGRTPAIGTQADIAIEGRERNDPLPKQLPRSPARSKFDIGAGQPLIVPVPGNGPIRNDSAARIESGDIRIYVNGFIEYSDLFGCRYALEFCGFYDLQADSENPLGLIACLDHNQRIERGCN